MYLNKKTYLYNRKGLKIEGLPKELKIKAKNVKYIEEEVCYWRKSNAIHAWFVRNVQNDIDDCKDYDVSESELKELLATVTLVLKDHSKAEELLPTQQGFFFGSYEYDQQYFDDLKDTKKMLHKALGDAVPGSSFSYSSSW